MQLVAVSSVEDNPNDFRVSLKEKVTIPINGNVGLVGASLRKSYKFTLTNNMNITGTVTKLSDGDTYTFNAALQNQSYYPQELAFKIESQINSETLASQVFPVRFTVQFDPSVGFTIGYDSDGVIVGVTWNFQEGLGHVMGFVTETLEGTLPVLQWVSDYVPGSKGAVVVNFESVTLDTYNSTSSTVSNILGMVPLSLDYGAATN